MARRRGERARCPALAQDAGFVGALDLAHPTAGDEMLIVLATSREEAARPLSTPSLELRHALSAIAALACGSEPRPLVWT